jgi:exopolysaccharide biosynthesis protein
MLFKNADKDDLIVILEYTPYRLTFGPSKAHCHIAFKPDDRSLKQLHREYDTAKFQTKFYLSQRKMASISVSKQAVLGIQMFVIDVDITERSQGFGRVH